MERLGGGGTVWLTRSARELPLRRGRLRKRRTLGPALGLGVAGTIIAAVLASSLQPPAPARAAAEQPDVAGKTVARLAPWGGPLPAAGAPASLRASESAETPPWIEKDLVHVAVVDGATLAADGLRIRLAGLALPAADESCRAFDGRTEACVTRAATQLELITRWRKVTCRYRVAGANEAVGSCRVGSTDLAEHLVKTGYVRHAASVEGIPATP